MGNFETYKHAITYKGQDVVEYIHCVVLEHVEEIMDEPVVIRVKQIHNLEEYFAEKEISTERILRVSSLSPVLNL